MGSSLSHIARICYNLARPNLLAPCKIQLPKLLTPKILVTENCRTPNIFDPPKNVDPPKFCTKHLLTPQNICSKYV